MDEKTWDRRSLPFDGAQESSFQNFSFSVSAFMKKVGVAWGG